MSADPDLIADDPDLAPLWTAIHDRLCSGQTPETIAAVRVPELNPAGIATLRAWLDTTARRRSVGSAVAVGPTGVRVPPLTVNSSTPPMASDGAVPWSERGICRVIATPRSGLRSACRRAR